MFQNLKDVDVMEVTNDVLNAVNRYFHTLSNLGYKKDKDVDSLIVYLFLEEFLCSSMSRFITETDYNTIDRALYCLYGTSCTVPYPDYKKAYTEVQKSSPDEYRVSEDGILRMTETDSVRTVI